VAILALQRTDKSLAHDTLLENLYRSFVIQDIVWLDRPLEFVSPLVTGVIYNHHVSEEIDRLCYQFYLCVTVFCQLRLQQLNRALTFCCCCCCLFCFGFFFWFLGLNQIQQSQVWFTTNAVQSNFTCSIVQVI